MATATFNWPQLSLVLTAWGGIPVFDPTHTTIATIAAAGPVDLGRSLGIGHQTVAADGSCQSDNVVIPTPPIGQDVTFFTMSELQTDYAASKLLFFIDDAKVLPFTPNGLDLIVTPDWLENRGWFRA